MTLPGGDGGEPKTGKRTRPTPLRVIEPGEGAPDIQTGVDITRQVDAAILAVSALGTVYQRAGDLVHVIEVPRGAASTPVIRGVKPALLRERMARAARWIRYDSRNKEWKPTSVPNDVVGAFAARGEWKGIAVLEQVVTSPTMRPDGSVLQTPGYDASTGLLFVPRATYPEVSEAPSKVDAEHARDALLEVVCDFPFASPAHRSAWLASLLTILARHAIAGPVPLFAIDATTRGTGKSRLVDAAVRLAVGEDAAKMGQPEDEAEAEKLLVSVLLEGDAVACFDNVSRPIESANLDRCLTATSYKGRRLGSNETVTLPQRTVWFANGNNLVLGGDLARRTLHVRLESPMENPEERTGFKHPNLIEWIDQNRHRLVATALTILRAWWVAGKPDMGAPSWGSFEAWSRMIPNVVRWVGLPCPLEARATAVETGDPEKLALRAGLHGVGRMLKLSPGGMTARAIVSALFTRRDGDPPDGHDDTREAIETLAHARAGKPPTSAQVGYALRRHRGRVVDGKRLVGAPDRNGTMVWNVVG